MSTTSDVGRHIPGLAQAQRIGRSLMLPIAALPAAALLLRLGQGDMLGRVAGFHELAGVLGAAGGALFDNLPLLFAVGVAIGYARKSDGSTALAAVVGYLVFKAVTDAMSPIVLGAATDGATQVLVDYGVLGGLVMGLVTAILWQRYYRVKLPSYLAFFGGRRFVPLLTALAGIVIGIALGLVYPWFNSGLTDIGRAITGSSIAGAFVYGFANRMLIPLGLHHILNSLVWFVFGDYHGRTGDLNRFFAGDPSAGTFMTGFFPIMMFALPAAALAIWREARPTQRKVIGGIMLSAALTSFLTGVTEPLEFSFMFAAFPLYVLHAVLTGTSLALVNALGIHDGFGFSAGFIDYTLNFTIAQRPLWLLVVGVGYGVLYYLLFRWVIRRWNLRTPGREDEPAADDRTDIPVAAGAPAGTGPAGDAAGSAADREVTRGT
jgi:PTS system N-acetylglucosamine-specific IIC component